MNKEYYSLKLIANNIIEDNFEWMRNNLSSSLDDAACYYIAQSLYRDSKITLLKKEHEKQIIENIAEDIKIFLNCVHDQMKLIQGPNANNHSEYG